MLSHPLDSFRRPVSVTVEYTVRGVRVTKTFSSSFTARRFYLAKEKAGASPRIVPSSGR